MELKLFLFHTIKSHHNSVHFVIIMFDEYIYVYAIVLCSCYLFHSHDYVNDSQYKFMLCICNATKH